MSEANIAYVLMDTVGETREIEGYRWRCMADPRWNEFDIVPAAH